MCSSADSHRERKEGGKKITWSASFLNLNSRATKELKNRTMVHLVRATAFAFWKICRLSEALFLLITERGASARGDESRRATLWDQVDRHVGSRAQSTRPNQRPWARANKYQMIISTLSWMAHKQRVTSYFAATQPLKRSLPRFLKQFKALASCGWTGRIWRRPKWLHGSHVTGTQSCFYPPWLRLLIKWKKKAKRRLTEQDIWRNSWNSASRKLRRASWSRLRTGCGEMIDFSLIWSSAKLYTALSSSCAVFLRWSKSEL